LMVFMAGSLMRRLIVEGVLLFKSSFGV